MQLEINGALFQGTFLSILNICIIENIYWPTIAQGSSRFKIGLNWVGLALTVKIRIKFGSGRLDSFGHTK